jgi:ribosome-associated toxin RatA of RatAB toxin-antitoxin module
LREAITFVQNGMVGTHQYLIAYIPMRRQFGCVVLTQFLALCVASQWAHAADARCTEQPRGEPPATAWVLAANTDAVCVYTHATETTNIQEIRAETSMAASPARILRVVSDYAHYPDFMPYVKTSEVIKVDAEASWVFQQLALPFPVSDRYYTIRLVADKHLADEGTYRVTWALAGSDVPDRTGQGVRLLTNSGYWHLQQLGDSQSTHVTYFVHTNPGGALPAWVINIANKESAPSVVKAVRARVAAVGADANEPGQ